MAILVLEATEKDPSGWLAELFLNTEESSFESSLLLPPPQHLTLATLTSDQSDLIISQSLKSNPSESGLTLCVSLSPGWWALFFFFAHTYTHIWIDAGLSFNLFHF